MLFLQEFIIFTIVLALFFDFINGFHDSANAISTVVATKVLSPIKAVGMAAVGNLIGPLFFSTAIAATIGKGIIKIELVQDKELLVFMIFSALVGAIVWDLITWYYGLPTSSSHALVGGLVGAGLVAIGSSSINPVGVEKVDCLHGNISDYRTGRSVHTNNIGHQGILSCFSFQDQHIFQAPATIFSFFLFCDARYE